MRLQGGSHTCTQTHALEQACARTRTHAYAHTHAKTAHSSLLPKIEETQIGRHWNCITYSTVHCWPLSPHGRTLELCTPCFSLSARKTKPKGRDLLRCLCWSNVSLSLISWKLHGVTLELSLLRSLLQVKPPWHELWSLSAWFSLAPLKAASLLLYPWVFSPCFFFVSQASHIRMTTSFNFLLLPLFVSLELFSHAAGLSFLLLSSSAWRLRQWGETPELYQRVSSWKLHPCRRTTELNRLVSLRLSWALKHYGEILQFAPVLFTCQS